MLGDAIRPQLARPQRAEEDRPGQSRDEDDGGEPGRSCNTQDRSGDEERCDRRRVVKLDRGLGRDFGEQVGGKLGQRREEHERRGQKEAGEG
jgi:hypothetical protein